MKKYVYVVKEKKTNNPLTQCRNLFYAKDYISVMVGLGKYKDGQLHIVRERNYVFD